MTDDGMGEPIDETPADDLESEAGAEDELVDDELEGAPEDEELEDQELAGEDEANLEPEPAAERRRRRPEERRAAQAARGGRGAPPASSRSRGIAIDPSLRIRDRVSQGFVILVVLVYLAIFLNAMAFGHGGAFTTTPAPTVAVSASPSAGSSGGASPAASPQGS